MYLELDPFPLDHTHLFSSYIELKNTLFPCGGELVIPQLHKRLEVNRIVLNESLTEGCFAHSLLDKAIDDNASVNNLIGWI